MTAFQTFQKIFTKGIFIKNYCPNAKAQAYRFNSIPEESQMFIGHDNKGYYFMAFNYRYYIKDQNKTWSFDIDSFIKVNYLTDTLWGKRPS